MERAYHVLDREESGKPRLITVAEVSPEERKQLPYLVRAFLPYRTQPNGLPEKGELDRVCRIEDKLVDALRSAQILHLGHITHDGRMTTVFHSPNAALRSVEVKTGILKRELVELESRLDDDWKWFDTEMAPTPEEKELSGNRRLHNALNAHGDDASKPRKVDFSVYFPTTNQRDSFIEAVTSEGYEPAASPTEGEADANRYLCKVSAISTTQPKEMAARCVFVRGLAERHGGEFDGWGTSIAK